MTPLTTWNEYRLSHAWTRWQKDVLEMVQAELSEVLPHISEDDVHWEAWRPLFDEGREPRAAVDRAFARD